MATGGAMALSAAQSDDYWNGQVQEYSATVSVTKSLIRHVRDKSSQNITSHTGFIGSKVSSTPEGAETEESFSFAIPLSRICVNRGGEATIPAGELDEEDVKRESQL